MGAGISKEAKRRKMSAGLKVARARLDACVVTHEYRPSSLEVIGCGFVVFYAGSTASNGESAAWLVLRINRERQPSSCRKVAGDVDYSDFHTRDISEFSLGGFGAGIAAAKALQESASIAARSGDGY